MMITSKDNETVKHVSKLAASASYRRKCGMFVAEGVRLCRDGVRSSFTPAIFFFTERAQNKYSEEFKEISASAEKSFEVSEAVLMKICDTKTPQGFFCVFNMLDKQKFPIRIKEGSYLALERIQDPSNMGTILRTAEALGAQGVILSDDCCDFFSPKVVRGSMGAVFRMPMIDTDDFAGYIASLTREGVETFASTPHNAEDITTVNFDGGVMLIGNEGAGLSDDAISACSRRVMIPMKGRAESLNAASASAILLWEMFR